MPKYITLGDRDYLIFQVLYLHRYLTSSQIYRLVCHNSGYHEGSLQRRLRKLVAFKYLGSRKEPVRESNDQIRTLKHYYLEDQSYPIIMDLNQNLLYNQYEFDVEGNEVVLKEFNMIEPTRAVIRGQVDHHFDMQELLIQAIETLNETNRTRFDDYHYGDGRQHRLFYTGDTLDDQGQEKSIVPDWCFRKVHDEQRIYIELDRGTERPQVLVNKFSNYDRHIIQNKETYEKRPFLLYVHLQVKPLSRHRRLRSMKRNLVGGFKRALIDRLVIPYVGAGTSSPRELARLINQTHEDDISDRQFFEYLQIQLDLLGHYPLQQVKSSAIVHHFNDALPHPDYVYYHDQFIINVVKMAAGEVYGEYVIQEWGKVAEQAHICTLALFPSKDQMEQETIAYFDPNALAVTHDSLGSGWGWIIEVTEGETPSRLKMIKLSDWLTKRGVIKHVRSS